MRKLLIARAARAGLVLLAAAVVVSAFAARTRAAESASISFQRGAVDSGGSIYLVSVDGGPVSRVLRGTTGYGDSYSDPAWSKDGLLAVRAMNEPEEGNDSSLVQVVGTPTRLFFAPAAGNYNEAPSWAPDGRRLVFVDDETFLNGCACGGPLNVWRVGATITPLTPVHSRDDFPAWSPDGTKIAFTRTSAAGDQQRLYLIRLGRPGAMQLTTSIARNPSWSPDSRRIVFDDGHRIAVVGADGTSLRYLTSAATQSTDPAWSPDGHWIAFVRRRAGVAIGDVWLMNARDRSQRLLVRNAYQPAWKS